MASILVPNIWQINIYDKITYIVDAAYKTGFISLTNVFIHQFSNF